MANKVNIKKIMSRKGSKVKSLLKRESGKSSKDKKYLLKSYDVTVHEDDFEEGELDRYTSFSGTEGKLYDSKKALIDAMNKIMYVDSYTEKEYNWDSDEGNIQTDVLVSIDSNEDILPADDREKALWREGKKKLYNARYTFSVTPLFKADEYAQGGGVKSRKNMFVDNFELEYPREEYNKEAKQINDKYGISRREASKPLTQEQIESLFNDLKGIKATGTFDVKDVDRWTRRKVTLKKDGFTAKEYKQGGTLGDAYFKSVNHFVFFSLNYPANFLDAWKDNGFLYSHLRDKFSTSYAEAGSYGAMNKFWVELDENNREVFAKWIEENYKGTELEQGGYANGGKSGKVKTKSITVFSFDDLSSEAQEKAIDNERNLRYQGGSDYAEQAVDDDYLFEPKHDELVKLFGEDFYKKKLNPTTKYHDEPLIENTRKNIYFSLDRNRHLDASSAMKVRNDKFFLTWLGLSDELQGKVSYKITSDGGRDENTIIEFEPDDYEYEFTKEEETVLDNAKEKFSDHMSDVLKNIESSYESNYSDETIKEELENGGDEFMEDGSKAEFKLGGSMATGGKTDGNPYEVVSEELLKDVKKGKEILGWTLYYDNMVGTFFWSNGKEDLYATPFWEDEPNIPLNLTRDGEDDGYNIIPMETLYNGIKSGTISGKEFLSTYYTKMTEIIGDIEYAGKFESLATGGRIKQGDSVWFKDKNNMPHGVHKVIGEGKEQSGFKGGYRLRGKGYEVGARKSEITKQRMADGGRIITKAKEVENKLEAKGVITKTRDDDGFTLTSTYKGKDVEGEYYDGKRLPDDIIELIDEYNSLYDEHISLERKDQGGSIATGGMNPTAKHGMNPSANWGKRVY